MRTRTPDEAAAADEEVDFSGSPATSHIPSRKVGEENLHQTQLEEKREAAIVPTADAPAGPKPLIPPHTATTGPRQTDRTWRTGTVA